MNTKTIYLVFCLLVFNSALFAQGASFTYQGRLADSGIATNGNYDLQFSLWNSSSGGGQVGSTQTINSVAISNGIFTVNLDFGANSFPGASRFLEIAVRPAGVGSFTILTPRQPITSTPYAVRSLNAATADSVPASGVPGGSVNYIQNSSTPQASTNFNINGNGTVSGALSASQFNIGGNRVLSAAGSFNLFAGLNAGTNNTGGQNSFFGSEAGHGNTTGSFNTFFGDTAGFSNTDGSQNSYFGSRAGSFATGSSNSYFGAGAGGGGNSAGSNNTFVGNSAGVNTSTGSSNSFFGEGTGLAVITGNNNTFVGTSAGAFVSTNAAGNNNTLLGVNANVEGIGVNRATAIGADAIVTQSNSLVLGSTNINVGIGTTAPTARLSVVATGDGSKIILLGTERPWVFKQFNTGAAAALELTANDANNNNKNFLINTQGNVGIGTQGPLDKLHVIGDIRVGVTGTNGCLKNNNGGTIIGTCSSDVRFKRNLVPFGPTLKQLTRLQPKYFFWRTSEFPEKHFGPARETGLIAQEVEQVLPELVSEDSEGFKQVDYSKLPLMLLQAVKEQQSLIQTQQQQIAGLKRLICRAHRRAAVCK